MHRLYLRIKLPLPYLRNMALDERGSLKIDRQFLQTLVRRHEDKTLELERSLTYREPWERLMNRQTL
ncbi:hypothetical protein HS1genome_2223 [Sulfodiicoccus acidiphilus]|uniref:Uncharacterized protein n=1 Tax=Sulfodiicoccus acidiphilus TaxID=1670455 RepID=A0A348B6N2_9CREN|nr:hypothetical protein HS1genome_2223 [Sulfodiicoccus acidiphilus]GGT96419.1 hypothetical protein GCM10007116_12510 [Sulfodiicoccus acidiphilus]